MAYNPVTNPNPENSRAHRPTGVMSQFDGNIVGAEEDPNVRYASSPPYGEDAFGDD